MQLWTGTVEFYDDGHALDKPRGFSYPESKVLGGGDGLPYEQSGPRLERRYRGSKILDQPIPILGEV